MSQDSTRCFLGMRVGSVFGYAVSLTLAFSGNCAVAQITPDQTLPNNSLVTVNGNTFNITGGTQAGRNLFHSFKEFSVPTGGTAYFNNVVDIQNIISRVTGQTISNIDGLIRANGTANLFLINPNGIVFGQNASLNIGGSFVASTASSLKFADGFDFSVTAPSSMPLLTISVPIGLQYGKNPGSILNQSQSTNSNDEIVGLQVQAGQSLALMGGEVKLDGGFLHAPGGRVELGGLAEPGTVGLNGNGSNLSLSFPNGVARADVSLTNKSEVIVTAGGGGSIAVNAQNLGISGESFLIAGIDSGRGIVDSQAGDIALNAIKQIKVEQKSEIRNFVAPNATGNGGNIRITAGSLSATNGAQLQAFTSGQGSAGNLIVDARDQVVFDGSSVLTTVAESGIGNGGDIRINTGSLFVTNDAVIATGTIGKGSAGNLIIDARENISFDRRATATTSVTETGIGNGGDIRMTTKSLSVTDDAFIATDTFGKGSAGNLIINARENLSFDRASASTTVRNNAIGNGGDIRMTTKSLSVTNGTLFAITLGQGSAGNLIINASENVSLDQASATTLVGDRAIGNGGDIRINTGSLSISNDTLFATSTIGQGLAGNLIINASKNVSFDGSNIFTSAINSGMQKSGDIRITTGSLSITNGAIVATSTGGQGNAGDIQINAKESVTVSGSNPMSGLSSALFTDTNSTGLGGNIIVNTNVFKVLDGAVLDAQTENIGNAGNITVNASLFEVINGGQLIATTSGRGRAGKIAVNVSNKATISGSDASFNERLSKFGLAIVNPEAASGFFVRSVNESSGIAGDIEVTSPKVTLDDQGRFIAESASGNGGNIKLQVGNFLLLRRGSVISATAGTVQQGGDGGNITINGPFIIAVPRENSHIAANAFTGNGGRVDITTKGIYGIKFESTQTLESDITASSTSGAQGQVTISQPDVQPTQGLIQLPAQFQDISNQIGQVCPKGIAALRRQSEFIITGHGSLPPSPLEPLAISSNLIPLATLESDDQTSLSNKPTSTQLDNFSTPIIPTQIVEAQGWVKNADGSIELVAEVPSTVPHATGSPLASCLKP